MGSIPESGRSAGEGNGNPLQYKNQGLEETFTSIMVCIWRRQWHPVLLPGKSHGWRSLVGCSPWGC